MRKRSVAPARATSKTGTARALRESEERFRLLAELSRDTLMRFDRQHRHLYVNAVVEAQTGIPAGRFIGHTHRELGFPADLAQQWERAIEQVFTTGLPHRIEFELPTGVWIDWHLVPERDSDGNVACVMTSGHDITARKQAEAAQAAFQQALAAQAADNAAALQEATHGLLTEEAERREAEERLRQLLEHLPVGIYRSTPDGQVLEANQHLATMLGYPSVESLHRINISRLYVSRLDRQSHLDRLRAAEIAPAEFELRRSRRET